VGNKISWSAVKETRNKSNYHVDKLVRRRENKSADTEACRPRTYSMQESCDLITSSFDDLYDDVDDETISVKTGSHDDTLLKAQTDSVGDPIDSVDSPSNDSLISSSSSSDDSAMMAESTTDSDSDSEESFSLEDKSELYIPDVWKSYYSRLQEIGSSVVEREGWPNFDAVFMISAMNSDGVLDIKVKYFCYFLCCCCCFYRSNVLELLQFRAGTSKVYILELVE